MFSKFFNHPAVNIMSLQQVYLLSRRDENIAGKKKNTGIVIIIIILALYKMLKTAKSSPNLRQNFF